MDKNTLLSIDKNQLCLQKASKEHIAQLQLWFTSKRSLLMWGGPKLDFPASAEQFFEQLTAGEFSSFSLLLNQQLIGFGQYQLYSPFMHLARVAINPQYQRLGFASVLLQQLLDHGCEQGDINQASLFVYIKNQIAYKTYIKKGFQKTTLPNGITKTNDCDYLTMCVK
ncbi:MAG: ribosomal protein S18 acetylase RimI-like enzyme [Kangiellaceae bacterium]|jgi:ribosomal protein S18 acetylase RimI-like enzyme